MTPLRAVPGMLARADNASAAKLDGMRGMP
ncbi:hypothetical protein TM4_gp32 [Mycobacterium phage TM4]|nr:hypothetical protein TM4_gp32 [Mycobacterium phage TM4]